jgi:hypothetical protein
MTLQFERGRGDAPAGHALIYFTSSVDGAVLATYLVVLPIALQLTKYVPPMLAAQLPLGELQNIGAVPLPPMPEPVESYAQLARLADLRRDDLINAGSFTPGDLGRAMALVAEVAQDYARAYDAFLRAAPAEPAREPEEQVTDTSVSDVIYGLMSEGQKLAELTKLAGQLRYAVEGGDHRQIDEAVEEIRGLAKHLPSSYDLNAFLEAAQQSGPVGERLSTLYLDRCFKLASEDYAAIQSIDEDIRRLRDGGAGRGDGGKA